jgi:nitroreductase
MHLAAAEAGVGSCWVQIHLRKDRDGGDAEDNVRRILGLKDTFRTVGILALGTPAAEPEPHAPGEADPGKIRFV